MKTARVFAVDLGASGGKCFAGIFERDDFKLQEVHRFGHHGNSFYIADQKGRVASP